MQKTLVILIVFTVVLIQNLLGQDKKKNKDFFNIKAPAIQYSVPDYDEVLFEESIKDSSGFSEAAVIFKPVRKYSMLAEDTLAESTGGGSDEGELSIVEVSEQMNVDSIWITIAEYFAIWDSRSVNPYKIDGSKFSDTLTLKLYDTLAGYSWSMPLHHCRTTSRFGMRHYRWHYGTDIGLTTGDPVLAAFDGIVRINKYDAGGYGNYVMLRHYNGLETLYGHLSKSLVEVGQLVKAGDTIGLGGSTGRSSGPHLHYEVRYEGNAIDPEEMYDFKNHTLKVCEFDLMPVHFSYLKEAARKVYYHKVKSGETLSTISRKYRVPIATICRLNGITTKSTLRVGQRLRIR
ncbi:MAG TPA: M23 family metallopeptidase [Cytophagaceae bacterium]